MEAYPTTLRNPNTIEDTIQKPSSSVVSIGGYAMTTSIGTGVNKSWKLTYLNLSESEKLSLTTFFDLYANETFTWVHPDDGVTYYVFFNVYNISFKRVYIDRYNCEAIFTQDNVASGI